jgi:signal transduction histidine kinase
MGWEIEGTGAGLGIVRKVAAKRHGGRAWVQACNGGSLKFIITFGLSHRSEWSPS